MYLPAALLLTDRMMAVCHPRLVVDASKRRSKAELLYKLESASNTPNGYSGPDWSDNVGILRLKVRLLRLLPESCPKILVRLWNLG